MSTFIVRGITITDHNYMNTVTENIIYISHIQIITDRYLYIYIYNILYIYIYIYIIYTHSL